MFGVDLARTFLNDCIGVIVKHGSENVLIWGCLSAKGVGEMTFVDGSTSL